MITEAPDLFLHLSRSDLVLFKGDLNHRKLTYDCAAPAATPFEEAIGPMASAPGAPKVCSLRTVKSDVVVGLPSNELADKLDKEEPGWKISGKYVSKYLLPVFRGLNGTNLDVPGCGSVLGRQTRRKGSLRVVDTSHPNAFSIPYSCCSFKRKYPVSHTFLPCRYRL